MQPHLGIKGEEKWDVQRKLSIIQCDQFLERKSAKMSLTFGDSAGKAFPRRDRKKNFSHKKAEVHETNFPQTLYKHAPKHFLSIEVASSKKEHYYFS